MRNQRGGVKIITLIGIVIALLLILFGVIAYKYLTQKDNTIKQENTTVENVVLPESNISQIDSNDNDFSYSFLKLENNQKNMIYSPLSIKYALKMLQEGADGNTYSQINQVVGNLKLPTTYKNIDKTLSLANGIYIRDTYLQDVKKDFVNTLANKYNAEIKYDKFENATNVNKWIEDKTFNIIKNMMKDDEVTNPNMKMLLINALAIDMEWESSFDFSDTHGKSFYLSNGKEETVTTMNRKASGDDLSYYINDKITAVTMNLKKYNDTQLEFMAIMPNNDLQGYIKELKQEDINNISGKLVSASKSKTEIEVNIPKFKFDYDLNLKDDLINMGIKDAFDADSADFSKIAKTKLYVGKASHKADIDFSEKGVKAAAVTVFGMMEYAMAIKEEPKVININKPFLFIIRDKNTKENWFIGTVYEPNLWENDIQEYNK